MNLGLSCGTHFDIIGPGVYLSLRKVLLLLKESIMDKGNSNEKVDEANTSNDDEVAPPPFSEEWTLLADEKPIRRYATC